MKILVVHPEDSALNARGVNTTWDFVLDLGLGSPLLYGEWSRKLNCPVSSLNAVRRDGDALRLRSLMRFASGRLIDGSGLDWWDLNFVFYYQQLEQTIVLSRLADEWARGSEITVSRPCFAAAVLQAMFGGSVKVIQPAFGGTATSKLRHYGRLLSSFSTAQLREILGDKYDPDYRVRRHFSPKLTCSNQAVVLLPSAYANASKMVAAYARIVPDQQFLLVATRRSATRFNAPANVQTAALASYAPAAAPHEEITSLSAKWSALVSDMGAVPELDLFNRAGGLQNFARMLATGMAIRDAWARVLDAHEVSAVFSGDEGNPHVRMPTLLASQRGIPTLSVHHGALDSRFRWNAPAADVVLAKDKMEADYLIRTCRVPAEKVAIGGPAAESKSGTLRDRTPGRDIVFFSEPYEVYGGRAEAVYRDVLPRLCHLADEHERKVILKLHPFESARERAGVVKKILSAEDWRVLEIMTAPLSASLLSRTWFGITVQSTVATECAASAVPCFLCGWLAESSSGYAHQFAKFGAGYLLESADEIGAILNLIASNRIPAAESVSSPLTPDSLRRLLTRPEIQAAVATG